MRGYRQHVVWLDGCFWPIAVGDHSREASNLADLEQLDGIRIMIGAVPFRR